MLTFRKAIEDFYFLAEAGRAVAIDCRMLGGFDAAEQRHRLARTRPVEACWRFAAVFYAASYPSETP